MTEKTAKPLTYSPKQTAEMTGIPTSTIRRYARDFGDLLSSTNGKRRQYTESDLVLLQRIRTYFSQKKKANEIRSLLAIVEDDPPTGFSLALIPAFQTMLESIQTETLTLRTEIEDTRELLSQTIAELTATRAEVHQLRTWSLLPWHKRIFTKPPKG